MYSDVLIQLRSEFDRAIANKQYTKARDLDEQIERIELSIRFPQDGRKKIRRYSV